MIRLPPTGIAISQNDLQSQLDHLDFYCGLLKQGFKKHEIIRYLQEQDSTNVDILSQEFSSPTSTQAPSTYTLLSQSLKVSSSPSQSPDETRQQFASPTESSNDIEIDPEPTPQATKLVLDSDGNVGRTYAPRQSSLLRFTRLASSESSEEQAKGKKSFPPRSGMTYRPRSQTYSYDQSELDEDDFDTACVTPTKELQDLSLDEDHTRRSNSDKTTVKISSGLRPEAEPFTPMYAQHHLRLSTTDSTGDPCVANSSVSSVPSSPPSSASIYLESSPSSPTLPPIVRVPTPAPNYRTPLPTHERSQQFLDGSFTVYNDSVPARFQPQTPAELSRHTHLNEMNAAYTAPPGMVRSTAARHWLNRTRQVSGDLSPTARASMIRERRQREFVRGLQVEGLRLDRAIATTRQPDPQGRPNVDEMNVWRDDLDADAVGDENFEDVSQMASPRRMRAVSGNRRFA